MNYLSSSLPAPMTMGTSGLTPTDPTQQMTNQNVPSYAHGGNVHARTLHRPGLVKAHFGRPEIEIMTHMQGGPEFDRKSGAPVFTKLGKEIEKILGNPYTKDHMIGHIREHVQMAAHGGHISNERAAHMGRHGDTEIAYIPQDLMHLFDEIGGRHRNPHTGYPEYFSLKGFFQKASPLFSRAGSAVSRGLGSAGSAMSRGLGSIASRAMPAMRNAASSFMGAAPEGGWGKALGGAAASGLANMAAAKLSGADWGDAAKMGALAGSQGFNTPASQALQAGLTTSLQGGNTRDSLLSGLSGGASQYDNSLGRGLTAAANMGLNGGNARDMALAGVGGAGAGSSNALMRGLGTAAHAKLGGMSNTDALLHGGLAAAGHPGIPSEMQPSDMLPEEEQQPAAHMARGGYMNYAY